MLFADVAIRPDIDETRPAVYRVTDDGSGGGSGAPARLVTLMLGYPNIELLPLAAD